VTGRRNDVELHEMQPGDYGRARSDGVWCCRTPNGRGGNLSAHEVVEHDDGTITVSPSILVMSETIHGSEREEWHGYLERGIWRSV
jgi:hypothetical protein